MIEIVPLLKKDPNKYLVIWRSNEQLDNYKITISPINGEIF